MKKLITLFFFIIFSVSGYAQDKNRYDLFRNDNGEKIISLAKTNADFRNYETTGNSKLEISMVTGGYYTIGLNGGKSVSKFDDNCDITYGHPYALTSYPFLLIDGERLLFDEIIPEFSKLHPVKNDTSIIIETITDGLIEIKFSLTIAEDGESVIINMRLKNLANLPQTIGGGIVFDPALGKWGDGHPIINGFSDEDEFQYSSNIPNTFEIWERNKSAKGIGINCSFEDELPAKLYGYNWNKFNKFLKGEQVVNNNDMIYDLILYSEWNERELNPDDSTTFSLMIKLLEPDFSYKIFTRWNMPQFLGIENNQMFPGSYNSVMEIFNTTNNVVNLTNREITDGSNAVITSVSNTTIPADSYSYLNVSVNFKITYGEKIEKLAIQFLDNQDILETVERNIYIPATPYSETGLLVSIDSLDVSKFPKVDFIFNAKVEETGVLINNLASENLFLYENNIKIDNFAFGKDTTGGVDEADIIFVLDVTGSMGEEINQVKSNIIEFADSLSGRGVDFRLGMITFLDEIENIYPFTNDVQYFQQLAAAQFAHGGGDGPENSLDALKSAAEFEFRDNANRVIVWITDADYHENDWATQLNKQQVINFLLEKGIQVHAIGSQSYKSSFYDPITIATGGECFNIYGNFRDILLTISRFEVSGKYFLSYSSLSESSSQAEIKLEVRYAGFGGNKIFNLNGTNSVVSSDGKILSCYPNPFNPAVTFAVSNQNILSGKIQIFNSLGQLVKEFNFDNTNPSIVWNAVNNSGAKVSSGMYFVRAVVTDADNRRHSETSKILYLK